jgi:hypothetical protein
MVEGVTFRMMRRGRPVRCVILRDALESAFGAGADPQSWLNAFRYNEEAIVEVAASQPDAAGDAPLVLLRGHDFPAWPRAAPAAGSR